MKFSSVVGMVREWREGRIGQVNDWGGLFVGQGEIGQVA
jgi:hypothetical protein